MAKNRAVAYLRASTKKQDASVADQRKAVNQYAKANGYKIIREYVDDGISGDDTEHRQDFLRMRDDAADGEFDWILCWDQSRFGRFDSIEGGHWIYPFRKAGIRLVTLDEGVVDWESFMGRLRYQFEQEAAHDHNVKLSRNVLRGQSEAAKKGSWIGSPPYAYKIVGESKNKRLEVEDEAKVAVVQRIFHEYVDEQLSMSAIASSLTDDRIISPGGKPTWRFDAVKVILENVAYVGTYRYNRFSSAKYHTLKNGQITKGSRRGRNPESDWLVIPNNHEPIIDKATFNKAQTILARGKTGRSPYTPEENPYLFSGLLRCGRCGSVMHGLHNDKYRYYECSQRKRSRKYDDCESCDGTSVREDVVIDALVTHIESRILGPDEVVDRLWRLSKRGRLREQDVPEAFHRLKRLLGGKDNRRKGLATVQRQIDQFDAQIAKAQDNLVLLDAEFIPAAQEKIRNWREKRDQLKLELRNQPTDKDINEVVLTVLRKVIRLSALGSQAEPDQIKTVLKEIDHIKVHTRIVGEATRRRHQFKRGDVSFSLVGVATGKVNPHRAD
ncbi:MAG: recombinase family protein [Pirellulaceae bacterium]